MEKMLTTQQALDELRSKAEGSTVLDTVAPLFDTLSYQDEYYPNRVSECNDYTQLLWKKGELQTGEFEQICLTLCKASLSVTIALNHRHDSKTDGVPILPNSSLNARVCTSMLINAQSHALYETNPTNAVLLDSQYDNEAITRFTPQLTHSLAVIGLYGYGQEMQREVG